MREREPIQRRVRVRHRRPVSGEGGALEVVAWEWEPEGEQEGPPVVLVHGIGLHGRTWDRVIREMRPSRRVFALDLSAHGASENPPLPEDGHLWWDDYGREVVDVARALDLPPALGVAHSMAGHSMIFAAEAAPGLFTSLLLLDPTVGSPEEAAIPEPPQTEPHPVSRRRNDWASPDEMFERFVSRSPFKDWDEGVLRDYCDHGLVREGDRYVLACPPALEATVWGGMSTRVYEAIAALDLPVHVARAGPRTKDDPPGWSSSQTWPGVYRYFRDATDELVAGRGHFFALETPSLGARLIEEALGRDAERGGPR